MTATFKTMGHHLALLPIIADLAALIALILLLPALSERLETPSGLNALLLSLLYVLFCIGTYLIRKLEIGPGRDRWSPTDLVSSPKVRAALAILFGLLLMTTTAYQLGFFDTILAPRAATLDEGDSAALFVFMPGALLGFSMLYVLVLAFPVKSDLTRQDKRYAGLTFVALLLTNAMLIFVTAQAIALTAVLNSSSSGLFTFIVALLVLVLSFGPPRLICQQKQPGLLGFLSFMSLSIIAALYIAI